VNRTNTPDMLLVFALDGHSDHRHDAAAAVQDRCVCKLEVI
jgi:hypothetical protein